jgi:hypothetical protein
MGGIASSSGIAASALKLIRPPSSRAARDHDVVGREPLAVEGDDQALAGAAKAGHGAPGGRAQR